ncbi:MAG: T9SS type A sorting domain-containing protein [Chitinophagales bacterium]
MKNLTFLGILIFSLVYPTEIFGCIVYTPMDVSVPHMNANGKMVVTLTALAPGTTFADNDYPHHWLFLPYQIWIETPSCTLDVSEVGGYSCATGHGCWWAGYELTNPLSQCAVPTGAIELSTNSLSTLPAAEYNALMQPQTDIMINASFDIDQDINLPKHHIFFAPGVSLNIKSGKTVNFATGTILEAACEGMWEGVKIETNATLQSYHVHTFDAFHGIHAYSGSHILLNSCFFARCYEGIFLDGDPNQNNLFDFVMEDNEVKFDLGDPDYSYMLAPLAGTRTAFGMRIENAGTVNVSDDRAPIDQIGANYSNRFIGLNNGISVVNSTLISYNNHFSNISAFDMSINPAYGKCIYSNGVTNNGINELTASYNTFQNVPNGNGILSFRCGNLQIVGNQFDDVNQAITVNQSLQTPVFVNSNVVNRAIVGMLFSGGSNTNYTIQNNLINLGEPLGFNGVLSKLIGIEVDETSISTSGNSIIELNTITGGTNGIIARSIGNHVFISKNFIDWRQNSFQSTGVQDGIYVEVGSGFTINDNLVHSNNGFYNEASASYIASNPSYTRRTGIRLNNSPNAIIHCNYLRNIGYGFQAFGACQTASQNFYENEFVLNKHAIVMRENGGTSGTLGSFIGSASFVNNNSFNSSYYNPFTNAYGTGLNGIGYKTWNFVNGSSLVGTYFFLEHSQNANNFGESSTNMSTVVTTDNGFGCGYINAGNGAGISMSCNPNVSIGYNEIVNPSGTYMTWIDPDQWAHVVATGSWVPNLYPEISLYFKETELFKYLKENPDVKNNDNNFLNFYLSKSNTAIEKFDEVQTKMKELALVDIQNAAAYEKAIKDRRVFNDNIAADKVFEEYLKRAIDISFVLLSDTTPLSPGDSVFIINLAKSCPYEKGSGVYLARNMFAAITGKTLEADDLLLCYDKINKRDFESEEQLTPLSMPSDAEVDLMGSENILIQPNPFNNFISISATEQSPFQKFELLNFLGELVFSAKMDAPTHQINLPELPIGLYSYRLTNPKGVVYTGKLVRNEN